MTWSQSSSSPPQGHFIGLVQQVIGKQLQGPEQ